MIRLKKKTRNLKSQQIQHNVELKSKKTKYQNSDNEKKPELEFLHKIKKFEKNK